jgi:hypothetical protein
MRLDARDCTMRGGDFAKRAYGYSSAVTIVPGVLETDLVLETPTFRCLPPSRLLPKNYRTFCVLVCYLQLSHTVISYRMRESRTQNTPVQAKKVQSHWSMSGNVSSCCGDVNGCQSESRYFAYLNSAN